MRGDLSLTTHKYKKTACYLETKKFDNFFKAIVSQMNTYQNYRFPLTEFADGYFKLLSSNKVNPDLANHILVTPKHYRCFSIHAHLKAGLHQAQKFYKNTYHWRFET